MSIWSVLLEALRNEEHSELIGDEVAIRRHVRPVYASSVGKRKLDKLIAMLDASRETSMTKEELKGLIQLLREQILTLQKRERELIMKEVQKFHTT